MKSKKLYYITCLIGLTTMTIGLLIFLTWWAGKAWFLKNYYDLEGLGLWWIVISLPLGITGLITGSIFLFKHFQEHYFKTIFALLCILINIPVLSWVLDKQAEIDKRAYVRFYNNSGEEIKSIIIKNSKFTQHIYTIEKDDFKTSYFYPNHDDFASVPNLEKVVLLVTLENGVKKILMPEIYKKQCVRLYIDKEFNIEEIISHTYN